MRLNLFVIAHPDDEAMFFVPTILALKRNQTNQSKMSLLCLSSGNAVGLGEIRKKELPASCKLLGIEDVMIVDDPRLPDGMNTKWDASVISNFISENVKNQLKQNENVNELVIYTFDEFGISNHANHISTHFGVKQFLSNPNLPTDLKKINAFKLETTNIVRKYLGLLDLPISNLFLSKNEKLYFTTTFIQSFKAMQQHHSQFVWFRYLFVLFSRYGFVNTLLPIEFNNK